MLGYHGMVHKYLKNFVSPENLRAKLLPEMDETTSRHVSSWASGGSTVDIKEVALDGRKTAIKVIKAKFNERRASNKKYGYFLDHLLEEVEKEDTFLSEDIAIDLAFVLLFATYETTSTAITLAVKFISDHPEVLAELVVINETVRLANIVPGIFRKVVHDVEVNAPSFIHLNLDKYDDPLAFNRSVAIEEYKIKAPNS
ncbi:Cytochrome P [Parasponia andersonii]|uniref:Cytochrome P n=1 Tax=Parasponia andersonii TaxID=3476 RepID=A0A2P5CAA7_PARAD|nr:Cytochrome P [Parasponia andersonii]